MIRYKKILMTLALLLTAVTGAWATPNSIVINGTPQVGDKSISLTYHFDPNNVPGITPYVPTLKVKCAADNKWDETLLSFPEVSSGTTSISLNTLGEFEAGKTYEVCFAYNNGNWVDEVFQSFVPAAPATYPFPITWDAKNKTTGFNLPAGNVFINVEYYPTAAVATAPAAKSDIKATTDDAIVTAGTVAKIGETENAQGTLMYYAVQSETAPEAPDYDNQGWSDKVPTAADFNQGNVYVWYYVKGADGDAESTFNDGAITKLGESGYVTLAAAPTYAITLKEDTEEADKWAISPAEAIKGTTVTATYSGTRKVKSVKAVKKNTAYAANEYNEASWDGTKVVFTKQTAASDPTAVANSAAAVTWSAGWYTVSGEVTITGDVTLGAETHLILQDGATLTINGKLYSGNYNLYIYGQSEGTGKLNITNSGDAIFCYNSFEIHGGEITAVSTNSRAIVTGILNVYSGKLTATGGNGIQFSSSFDVYGGEIEGTSNATSSDSPSRGITDGGYDKTLTVYGGKVTATGNGKENFGVYGSGFRCYVKSGTSGIKFYFSADGTTWGDGTSYASATLVGTDDATKKRYAKAE